VEWNDEVGTPGSGVSGPKSMYPFLNCRKTGDFFETLYASRKLPIFLLSSSRFCIIIEESQSKEY
jgi:hypothetical protein